MVTCESYISVSKDMKFFLTMIKGEGRESGSAFMSNTNYQRIEN